jgi:iron complex outermembrane recepter protein
MKAGKGNMSLKNTFFAKRFMIFLAVSTLSNLAVAESTNSSHQNDMQLEEVVVTAQKKRELLHNVPASVSTLKEESLNAILSSGDDVRSLANQIPGLYVESSNGRIAPRFYMRGLGNVDFDLAASQPVSVIFDNVVQENVILKSFPIFDVESVEAIRGPQGTLFGRNTTAGIVKFTSKRPTQNTDGFARINYGTFNTVNFEGAVGGSLIDETLSGRIAVLSQNRDDWINNTYKNEKDAFGGHRELAARAQLLFEPNDSFDALLNYHARDLDGSQTAFMANVFTRGSNNLNENYDRENVFYDEGDDNTQKYKGSGASLTLTYDFGSTEFTSISAYEEAKGSNTGDIDGGVSGVGPGFIPFSSATIDAGDIQQKTQEFHWRSLNPNFWEWQLGAFYFDSDLSVTTDAGFNIATVYHENSSWAVFSQNTFNFTDHTKVGVGVRYTEDDKSLDSLGVQSINVQDDQVSWDLSINHSLTDMTSVYTRVADGFRAPSIQGRDIAFFGAPSVADSEKILSYEAGIKSDFLERKLRLNAAVFYYTIDGFQLSAIGGTSNSNSLLNADDAVGKGAELDIEYLPTVNLKFTAGLSINETEIKDAKLYTAVCGSGQCTPTDPLDGSGNASIDGNPFPGAPDTTFNFTIRYQIPTDNGNLWYIYSDWAYQGKTNLALYESKEFYTDGQFEGGLRIGYETQNLDVAFFSRNITDEHNVKGFVDFNNNTGFVNEPRIVGVELKYKL